jgi:hypothetical protein
MIVSTSHFQNSYHDISNLHLLVKIRVYSLHAVFALPNPCGCVEWPYLRGPPRFRIS